MVEEVDEDGSGTIDFDEFCQMMGKQLEAEKLENIPERPEKELSEAFRIFDINGSGYLEMAELEAAFKLTGENVELWEIEHLILDGDKNEDGRLDYEEWIDMMKHTPQL